MTELGLNLVVSDVEGFRDLAGVRDLGAGRDRCGRLEAIAAAEKGLRNCARVFGLTGDLANL